MIKSVNQVSPTGTCLQGYVTIPYSKLVEKFGKPEESDGDKIDAEWVIQFEDDSIATIYNWKNGKNYCGEYGLPTSRITEWNVGGASDKVLSKLQSILEVKVSSSHSPSIAAFFS